MAARLRGMRIQWQEQRLRVYTRARDASFFALLARPLSKTERRRVLEALRSTAMPEEPPEDGREAQLLGDGAELEP